MAAWQPCSRTCARGLSIKISTTSCLVMCTLQGPLNQDPNFFQNVTFSMGIAPNSIQLALRGRLYISNLVSEQMAD